jgi:hypothetical protein
VITKTAEGVDMTRSELMMKWPRHEFKKMKLGGDFAASVTYEQFLDMKMSQVELARPYF